MKKTIIRKICYALTAAMLFTSVPCIDIGTSAVYAAENGISIIESGGWMESAWLKWAPVDGADSYKVYYKKAGSSSYTEADKELIREYDGYFRADIPGLSAGEYILKVVPVTGGAEGNGAETGTLSVENFVREGFAFSPNSPCGYTTGGYNKDGTVNPAADIVYVTNENKNTVTINGDTAKGVGINGIFAYREKNKIKTPLVVRLIGKVEMPEGVTDYMMGIKETENVTFEGIGDDAAVYGWGLTMKRARNVEVRNIGIMLYGGIGGDGDSLSLDTENKNIWLHNIDFFYGEQGKDSDQTKGDGSIDLKARSDYITVSYNHFWDSGKTCVAGGVWEAKNPDDPEAKIFVTYHHNWFDHSDSRHPRCVAANVHVYNNYYDGNSTYGIGAAVQSSIFAEGNYFRNCKRPMLIATQGSDCYDSATGTYKDKGTLSGQTGGMIKEYNNIIIGASRFYTQLTTPDEGQIDAYHAESRDEIVPETVKALSGGHTYNNFDTSDVMYEYSPHAPEDVPAVLKAKAGRMNGGDFKWTFTEEDDELKDLDPELKAALVNYESPVVRTFVDNESQTETSTGETTETTTEGSDASTETTTSESVPVSVGSWNADMEIPSWLNVGSGAKNSNSSSHKVFQDVDTDIAQLSNRYEIEKNNEIKINLSGASIVKIYIAGNDNGAGKGTVTATLDGNTVGSYSLPGRKDSTAVPFEVKTDKGGILVLNPSYKSLLYKIEILSDGDTPIPDDEEFNIPVKIINNTDMDTTVKIGENNISVTAGNEKSTELTLKRGTYAIGTALGFKAEPASIEVSGDVSEYIVVSITKTEIKDDGNIIVTDSLNNIIGYYDKISDAISAESTVAGCIISVKPGYYNDGFDVNKSVTIQKAEGSDGEVVIYNTDGAYGKSMKGAVRVSANNVTLKNITLLNNTNAGYGDISAESDNGTTAAALIADGENSVYENCKFISVQDTIVTAVKKTYKQTYNNCTFYGATDFVCGSCNVDFNNCEFRIFTGNLPSKVDSYIFAPNVNAEWRVNGGRIVKDEKCTVTNFFYARPWESNSSTSMTLDIYGIDNEVEISSAKGLMGFGGPTGGGRSHSISEFKFNVYEGADSSTPLVATTDVTNVSLFEISKEDCISFANDSSSKLLTGVFGENVSDTFIKNVLPDIVDIGFVSLENADASKINESNSIVSTSVYKKITSVKGSENELSADINAPEGAYVGVGVLRGAESGEKITVVPYVKFDASYGSSDGLDETPVYRFGSPVEIEY